MFTRMAGALDVRRDITDRSRWRVERGSPWDHSARRTNTPILFSVLHQYRNSKKKKKEYTEDEYGSEARGVFGDLSVAASVRDGSQWILTGTARSAGLFVATGQRLALQHGGQNDFR